MAGDRHTYGFSKQDARDLLQTIGGGDVEFPEIRPRGRGGGGSRLVRFELTASLASGTGAADFQEMDGTAISSDTLRDPEAIFAVLDTGDRGLAMLQGGQYFAVQAKCPPEPEV